MNIVISIVLLSLSALFSGLVLGLLSINKSELERKIRLGDKRAEKIYQIRQHPNRLLITLVMVNVLVNSILSVFLASIMSGLAAVVLLTVLIVVFSEILPQAIFARHAMAYTAPFVPLVKVMMILMYPIAQPMSWILERFIGKETATIWDKDELEELIKDHHESEKSDLSEDEGEMLIGAISFSDKKVGEVMTYKDNCFLLEDHTVLTEEVLAKIKNMGFTRVPIFDDYHQNILGILYTKDLILVPTGTPIMDIYRKDSIFRVHTDLNLDKMLKMFIKRRIHMAYVLNKKDEFVGLITLEDIVEEIISQEIEDETDTDED